LAGRILLASAGMGAALWGWLRFDASALGLPAAYAAWVVGVGGVAVGGFVFALAALLLRLPEVAVVAGLVRRGSPGK